MRWFLTVICTIVLALGVALPQQATAQTEELAYLDFVIVINEITRDSMSDVADSFNELSENPLLTTDTEYMVELCGNFAIWDAFYSLLKDIDPPTRFSEIHDEMLEAYRNLSLAGGYSQDGVLNLDIDSIELATFHLQEATEHIQNATELVEEIT